MFCFKGKVLRDKILNGIYDRLFFLDKLIVWWIKKIYFVSIGLYLLEIFIDNKLGSFDI